MTRFLIGFAALFAALSLSGGGAIGFVAVLLVFLVVARDRRGPFRRPPRRALVAALVVAALIQVVHLVVDADLRPAWWWLLVTTFAFHGVAEELVWRVYVYGRLREGRAFSRAVLWSMPFVMVAHIPIVLESGWLVGGSALLVAAVTSVPLARLYDLGLGTVWAPAIVHAGIDSFKLVEVSSPQFPLMVSAAALVVPFLIFVPLVQPKVALRRRDG